MGRRTKIVVTAVAIALLVPTIAAGSTGSGALLSPVNRQFGTWRTTPVSTTSTRWRPLSGLGGRICSMGEVAAAVSVNGSGAPMQLRVLIDWGASAAPGPVAFTPVGKGSVGSFTFITGSGAFEGNDHHVYLVEWRSLNGLRTTVNSATTNLVFQKGNEDC